MTEHYQFADLEWQSRWNKRDAPHLWISQSGSRMFVVAFFGVIMFDLENDEDVDMIVHLAEQFAETVRKHKEQYDEWKSS